MTDDILISMDCWELSVRRIIAQNKWFFKYWSLKGVIIIISMIYNISEQLRVEYYYTVIIQLLYSYKITEKSYRNW